MSHKTEKYYVFSLILIFMNIDSGGQCHSDKTVNVEEFCLTALLLA